MGPFTLLGTILIIFGGNQWHRVEREVANDIRAQMGDPQAKIRVRMTPDGPVNGSFGVLQRVQVFAKDLELESISFFTEPERNRDGLVKRLDIQLENVVLKNLRIESLTAQIDNCRFDRPLAVGHRKIRISESGTGWGQATITQEALTEFAAKRYPTLTKPEVKLEFGKVSVSGDVRLPGLVGRVRVLGTLASPNGSSLALTHPRIWINDKRLDSKYRPAVLALLGDFFDINKDLGLVGAVKIESIVVRDGKVTLSGPVRHPNRPLAPGN